MFICIVIQRWQCIYQFLFWVILYHLLNVCKCIFCTEYLDFHIPTDSEYDGHIKVELVIGEIDKQQVGKFEKIDIFYSSVSKLSYFHTY